MRREKETEKDRVTNTQKEGFESFTDFSKGQRWGWGVNFVDVSDCWEFKNTNFKFSYVCAQFSALHFFEKILTDRLEILVCF